LPSQDIKEIKTIAVDRRSQSSTGLLRIVFEIFYGIQPTYVAKNIDKADMLDGVDGAMMIGDSGLRQCYADENSYKVYDLGEMWTDETGLPFVYAVFAMNQNVILGHNLHALIESKKYGLGIVDKIAEIESTKLGIDYEICFKYLTERIKYGLGDEEIKGMIRYSELLSELDQAEKISSLKLYHE